MSTVLGAIFRLGSTAGCGRPLHRDTLLDEASQARRALRLERDEVNRLRREHSRAFLRAQAQARRDARHLLKVLDHLPRAG